MSSPRLIILIVLFSFVNNINWNNDLVDPSWQLLVDDKFNSVETRNYWYYGASETPLGVTYLERKNDSLLYEISCSGNIDEPTKVFYRQLKKPEILSDGLIELNFKIEKTGQIPGYGISFRANSSSFYLFWINDTNQTFDSVPVTSDDKK